MKKNLQKVFKTGDKLKLRIDRLANKEFHAIVEDVLSANELLICIDNYSNPIGRHHEDPIHLTAFRDDMGIFKLSGQKISIVSEDNYTYIGLRIDDQMKTIQRRQYFRLKVLRDIEIIGLNGYSVKGMSKDISGGGMRFVAPLHILEGAHITINFQLSEFEYSLDGICLGSRTGLDGRLQVVRVKFIRVTDRERQRIISGIFSIQRGRR